MRPYSRHVGGLLPLMQDFKHCLDLGAFRTQSHSVEVVLCRVLPYTLLSDPHEFERVHLVDEEFQSACALLRVEVVEKTPAPTPVALQSALVATWSPQSLNP